MRYCDVTEHIFELIRLLEEENKKPKEYGVGVFLGYAEVQFLETVDRYPDENVSQLSQRLGITKGAVTQMAAKLSQKGLLEQRQRQDNKQMKYFSLTAKAEMALKKRQQYHQKANQKLCQFVTELNQVEAHAVFRFLAYVKECVPFCQFPCEHKTDKENIDYVTCARFACRT